MSQSPPASYEIARRTMVANRSRNTSPELMLRRALWRAGVRGYRLHSRTLPGRPDVSFSRKKVAVFVHGCWWHGCPHCGRYRTPKANTEYWVDKLIRNKKRDAVASEKLTDMGFEVVIVWECEVKRDLDQVVSAIVTRLA